MANRYAGTPLSSEWDAIQRRRAINQALLSQAMNTPGGTQFVRGGRVGPTQAVPYSWGTAAEQIGKALIARQSAKKADEQEKALSEQFDTRRQEGMDKVTAALTPEPENYVEINPAMKDPDYLGAATELGTNPYLRGNDIAKAMVNAQAYGGRGRGGYSKILEDEFGRTYAQDMRDPNAQPRLLSGEGGGTLFSPKSTPRALYSQNRAKQLGTGGAELVTDPATASAVEAAKQGRIGVLPQTQAQEAADKAQAESEQARAFNAQGITEQVVRVEELLAGVGTDKPTGSWVGAILDGLGNIVGVDVPGSIPAERLKTIGAQLASKPPRFEGPQSDHDVNLYKDMAGMVGNDKISPAKRQAKVEEFSRAFAKYEEVSPGKFVDNTKTQTGMTAEKEARFRKRLEQERGQ